MLAIAVPVPDAFFRAAGAQSALPMHVPLVDPFAALNRINDSLLVSLVRQFANAPGICGEVSLTFDRVERSADAVALGLANPAVVTEKGRALAEAWRKHPAALELGIVHEPRMIIARGDTSLLDASERAAAGMLPFTSHARLALLLVRDEAARLREHFRLA